MICRLIALDLDGTLLNSKKMISPASVSALQSAQQAGVKIILATGRSHSEALPYYQQLQLTEPMICCNGSYLYHRDSGKYCVRCRWIPKGGTATTLVFTTGIAATYLYV